MGEQTVLFDQENLFVGVLKKRYEAGEYLSPHNNEPVEEPVYEFEDGNCFIDRGFHDELKVYEWELFKEYSRHMLQNSMRLVKSAHQVNIPLGLVQAMVRTSTAHNQQLLSTMYEKNK